MATGARKRFSWAHLPPPLLRALQRDLALAGEPVDALRRRFGARPSPEFVGAAWGTLRDTWLRRDRAARTRVVEGLRSRRLGDLTITVRSAAGQMDYLRSCRNGATLRGIVADTLASAGQAPSPPPTATAAAVPTGVDVEQPPATSVRSKAWQRFVSSLAASLGILGADHHLIIRGKDRPWLLQFTVLAGGGLRAELSEHSEPGAGVTPDVVREWPAPVAVDDVARFAVDLMVEHLDVTSPSRLEYTAFDDGGTTILLPTLGLPSSTPPPDETTVLPLDAAAIMQQLLGLFRRMSGNDALDFDPDGDIPLRYGTAMVFVRAFAEPPVIRVFSPVLTDIGQGLDLLETANRLNDQYFFTKWFVSEGVVVAAIDLFGRPLVEQHVLDACGVVGETADNLDEQLQREFGGRTFFGEYLDAKPAPGTGGYL